jgi:hypothetical protein
MASAPIAGYLSKGLWASRRNWAKLGDGWHLKGADTRRESTPACEASLSGRVWRR